MATPAYIRPSISRIINASKLNSTLVAALPTASSQKCSFSSTPEYNNRRPRRDNNRLRGLSSIYRSGTRFRMNIDASEAPKPAKFNPNKVKIDPNHGLWEFFYSKERSLATPEETAEHGRGWTVEELRHKSWDDLHKLWWVCVKEQNRLATARKERSRLKLPDGNVEGSERLDQVRKTMRSIKHTLTERWYLWEDARKLAENDPEIDLTNPTNPFTPKDYLEEHEYEEVEEELQDEREEQTKSNFMSEEPRPRKPEQVDPSTISSKATETQQTSTKP